MVDTSDLPGIDVKEVAEMVARAAIENINKPQPLSSSSGIELQEDEQWTLAAYMEGIGEFQEEMDASQEVAQECIWKNTTRAGSDRRGPQDGTEGGRNTEGGVNKVK